MHIFISYAKQDTYNLAVSLRDHLRQLDGVTVWMDETLEPGESWASQIQDEINAADYVVVLLSPDVNRPIDGKKRRSFVLNEIDYAQQENKTIIPVMAQKTRVPVQIAGIQFIDFTDDPAKGLNRLLRKIAPRLAAPLPDVKPVTYAARTPSLQPAVPVAQVKNLLSKVPRRRIVIGALALLAVVLIVLLIVPALNPSTFDQTSFDGVTNPLQTMVALQELDTATAVAATQAKNDQIATSQADFAATNVVATHIKQGDVSTTEAQLAATNVVKTQVNQDQLATNEANIAATNVVATQVKQEQIATTEAQLTATHVAKNQTPFDVVTANTDWTPVYQTFDGVEMALVPVGCFMMGSENGQDIEKPVNQQCFEQPFWIDRYEVNNEKFGSTGYFEGDNFPRDSVTWFQAHDFCAKRGMHLPTEREWEYAARGPDNLAYPWGNDFIEDNVVHESNSNGKSHDVGSRHAGDSWVGASDLSGNVWEWVSTLLWDYPYAPDDGREDLGNESDLRVVRGGSWGLNYTAASAYHREGAKPTEVNNEFGFRCARDY